MILLRVEIRRNIRRIMVDGEKRYVSEIGRECGLGGYYFLCRGFRKNVSLRR